MDLWAEKKIVKEFCNKNFDNERLKLHVEIISADCTRLLVIKLQVLNLYLSRIFK